MCSGATRIFTEWPPSLYRDDDLSSSTSAEDTGQFTELSRVEWQ